MDITAVFGTAILGSNPGRGTIVYRLSATHVLLVAMPASSERLPFLGKGTDDVEHLENGQGLGLVTH